MQDIQNIPNPDVNLPDANDGFGSHSDQDIERPDADIPVPPTENRNVPIEEPPTERDQPPVDEDETAPKLIV